MKQIITKDESITFYNEEFDETYHSISGALEEAVKKFSEAVNIRDLAKEKNEINILDICFGLGYNSAAAIDLIKNANPNCKINVIGLEIDSEILNKILKLPEYFDSMKILKKLVLSEELDYSQENVKLKIILGDACETIKTIKNLKFDIIFLDPFSPKKCPALWGEDFFNEIFKRTNLNGTLATYSCARVVRDNLKNVGFTVTDGPCVGRRSPATLAKRES